MKSLALLLSLTTLLVAAPLARAQPGVPASTPETVEEPAPQSAPAPAPMPDPEAQTLQATYDRAFASLTHGQFADAIEGFDVVALQSSDSELRGSARELARLARRYKDSGIRFSQAGGPSATVQPAPLVIKERSDDDEPNAGRAEFVVSTTLAAFYAGIAVDILLDIDDFRTATLFVTAATAAGFVGSLQGSKGKRITGGMASGYSLGLGIGLGNGLLMASPLGFANDADLFVSSGLVGMVLGGASAMILADKSQPTRGQMSFASTLSLLGVSTMGLGLVIAEPDISSDAYLTMLTLGLDAGLIAGVALSPGLDWSSSRANLVNLSAFLGAVGGFGAMALVAGAPDDGTEGKIFASAVLAGIWGGYGLGVHFTKDMSPDKRFADPNQQTVAIMPSLVGDAPGLMVMGSL